MIIQRYLKLRKSQVEEGKGILTWPNVITLLRLLFIVPVIFFGLREQYLLSVLFSILFVFGDVIDGHIARVSKTTSKTGRYLDPIVDKLGWSAVVGVIIAKNLIPLWIIVYVIISHVLHPIIANQYKRKTQKRLDKARFQVLVNIAAGCLIVFDLGSEFFLACIVVVNTFHLYYYTKVGLLIKKEKKIKKRTIGNEDVLWYGSFALMMYVFFILPEPEISIAILQVILGVLAFVSKKFFFSKSKDREFHMLAVIWMLLGSLCMYWFWQNTFIVYIILVQISFFYSHRLWHKILGTYPLYIEKKL